MIFWSIFLSHSTKKIRRGEPICVSEFFWHRKLFWIRRLGGGSNTVFPSGIFCLTVPKKFVGETFSNPLPRGIETIDA